MMSEQLLKALKKHLKSKGISYQQVGEALGLSTSSVKRLFAERSFTLPHLELALSPFTGALFAYFIFTFIVYWWHRARRRSRNTSHLAHRSRQ